MQLLAWGPIKESIESTYGLLDFAVIVGVEHAVGAVRAVARHEHAAEAVILEAVASARRLVAPDWAPLALGVAVELAEPPASCHSGR